MHEGESDAGPASCMEAELVIAWELSYTELACMAELDRDVMKSLQFTILTAGGPLSPPEVEVYRACVSSEHISRRYGSTNAISPTSRRAKAKEAAPPLWFLRDTS